jgi:hypothetical protein
MIEKNKDITNLSNFKTKAFTKYFYEFNGDIKELKKVLSFANSNKIKVLFVSG